ncbi:unnamed protein product [Brachionus calyciflorus]|uniref:SET domain-containing protein n=1 Tax=Brachionus calyciflorus TaxID=104777 RepID=A0A813M8Y3_9BILA|nr:unnamed protein product [Brachionus calyciflorus]
MSTEIEIELPDFIELKESTILLNDLGAYSRTTLQPSLFIGTYKGKIRNSVQSNEDLSYIWTILNTKKTPMFYIDATDPRDSNWLRFVRASDDFKKQNIVCLQQDQKINYYTLKEIKPGDELVYFSPHDNYKKAKLTNYEIVFNASSENSSDNLNEESKDSFNTPTISDEEIDKSKISIKTKTTRSRNGKKFYSSSTSTSGSSSNTILPTNVRIWTCQMCKKQFDQRILLNRHDCIDLKLRIFKKKKELRKKKLKDLHWKRKIDQSYIETTNFTHLFNNIADNLSFCVDGTKQDLKSYSQEVKDYLNSMINKQLNQVVFRK